MLLMAVSALSAMAACAHPWVFFDLGDTLVDTKTHNFEKVFYMPGAHDYVETLRARGFHIGILANYPDRFGATPAAKITHMKDLIAKTWWVPQAGDPKAFDWNAFDAGVFVPPTDADAKPKPYLFQKGISLANAAGCRAVFEGESAIEVQAASSNGMIAFDITKGYPTPEVLDEQARKTLR